MCAHGSVRSRALCLLGKNLMMLLFSKPLGILLLVIIIASSKTMFSSYLYLHSFIHYILIIYIVYTFYIMIFSPLFLACLWLSVKASLSDGFHTFVL